MKKLYLERMQEIFRGGGELLVTLNTSLGTNGHYSKYLSPRLRFYKKSSLCAQNGWKDLSPVTLDLPHEVLLAIPNVRNWGVAYT